MREWRKRNRLTAEQRAKDNARSHASMAVRRGQIERRPCGNCNDMFGEMHHDDYDDPLAVEWLCRPCHLKLHRKRAA
jgi:hypothetical protein